VPGSDVKPDNIIVLDPQAGAPPGSEQRCRLLDYGLAGKASNFKRNAYIQSRYYRSPEVLVGLPATHAVDLWSAGAAPAAGIPHVQTGTLRADCSRMAPSPPSY